VVRESSTCMKGCSSSFMFFMGSQFAGSDNDRPSVSEPFFCVIIGLGDDFENQKLSAETQVYERVCLAVVWVGTCNLVLEMIEFSS